MSCLHAESRLFLDLNDKLDLTGSNSGFIDRVELVP